MITKEKTHNVNVFLKQCTENNFIAACRLNYCIPRMVLREHEDSAIFL